ncbi:MAG TPA: hypothetical protein VN457_03385, partial [Chlamydiales bacterium]|nr:hypothetical protein [Chlamydiales bacterium]
VQSGFEILRTWLEGEPVQESEKEDQIITAIYYLNAVQEKEKATLTEAEKKAIEKAYLLLKNLPFSFGITALHRRALLWVESEMPQVAQEALKKTARSSSTVPLPKELEAHASFKKVFGPRSFSAVPQKGASSAETIYTATVEGRKFRLQYNKVSNELRVFQDFQQKEKEPSLWCEYISVQSAARAHSDATVEKYGLWVKDDHKAYAVFADQVSWKAPDCYVASMKEGHIEKLSSFSEPQLTVGFDPHGAKTRQMPQIHPSRVVLLREGNQLKRIQAIGYDLAIENTPEGWMAKGKYEGQGLRWVDPKEEGALLETTKGFLSKLGSSFENIILAFSQRREGVSPEDKLLLFPHRVLKVTREGVQPTLHFEKESIESAPSALIEVSVSQDGKIETSTSGFVYLAVLAAHRKDYKAALILLQEAEKRPFKEKEEALFKQLSEMLQELKPVGLQATAFQLKAELLVNSIRRLQAKEAGFLPKEEA